MIGLEHLIVDNANAGATRLAGVHIRGVVSPWAPIAMATVEWRPPGRPQDCSSCSPSSLSLSQSVCLSSPTQHRNAMTDACVFMLCLGDRKEEEEEDDDEARTSSTALNKNNNNNASHRMQHR